MEALLMRHFCHKYKLGQHTLSKRLKEYDIVWVDGKAKPRIVENEKNIKLAKLHSKIPAHRPRLPIIEKEAFMSKYNIEESKLRKRWKCLQKIEIEGKTYISETRTNLRHCKLI